MKGLALFTALLFSLPAVAQNDVLPERISTTRVKLMDPALGNREAGTLEELNAAVYIMTRMKMAGLEPAGKNNNYFQAFPFWQINTREGYLKVNYREYKLGHDFHIMPFSGSGSIEDFGLVASQARDLKGNVAVINDFTRAEPGSDDFLKDALEQAKRAEKQGASGVILTHFNHDSFLPSDAGTITDTLNIPVILAGGMIIKQSTDASAMQIEMKVNVKREERVGYNILGKTNHKSENLCLLASHYDGNAGDTGINQTTGIAVMLELAEELKKKKYKESDYLFVFFSGHHKGMAGEKWFTINPLADTSKISLLLQYRHLNSTPSPTRVYSNQEPHFLPGIASTPPVKQTLLQEYLNKPFFFFTDVDSGNGTRQLMPLSPEKVYLISLDLLKLDKFLRPKTQKNGKI